MTKSRPITKTLFEAGQQCAKRLYLEYHYPKKVPPLSEWRQDMAETGRQLIEMARSAFPKGHSVAEADDDAVVETKQLLDEATHAVLFDAAFRHEDLLVRSDIVLRNADGSLDLFEVKSGVKVKPRHVLDLALQTHTIVAAGQKVRATYIVHLNPKYRHEGGKEHPVHQLFKNTDVTARVQTHQDRVIELLESHRSVLADESSLELPTGTWCSHPFQCPFLERCTAEGPDHPLRELPDLTHEQEAELHQEAIEDLAHVDAQRPGLTLVQRRALQALDEERLIVEPFVLQELEDIDYPLHFLVVHYLVDVLPRFAGGRPWRPLPFLWSTQVMHSDGKMEHHSFLRAERGDFRADFVSTLSAQLRETGTVFCYDDSNLEQLRPLLEDLPDSKAAVRSVLQAPRIDLGSLIEAGVQHPGFHGNRDLRTVADTLLSDQDGSDLAIQNIDEARSAYRRIQTARTRATTREKLGAQLLELGEWESMALLKLYQQLTSTA